MDRPEPVPPTGRRRPLRNGTIALIALFLLSGPAFASCSSAHEPATGTGGAGALGAMPTMTGQVPDVDATPATGALPGDQQPAGAREAWDARPDYVKVGARTEEAYAYAMYHSKVIEWMPCYCGCGGMGHRSNLDCYFKAEPGGQIVFEEHASYCDICVDTTLLARKMVAEGRTLREIRDAVDQTFGGSAPGTPTELPPAG